nr:hypothetical protein [Tanacetum cinerariifolium]
MGDKNPICTLEDYFKPSHEGYRNTTELPVGNNVVPLRSDTIRYDPLVKGVTFRLGGEEREMSLLEFGWRVGFYSERESREVATLSGLRGELTVNSNRLNHLFWPSIGDGRKTSLVKIGVIIELHEGVCCWLNTRGIVKEGKGDDEEGDKEGETEKLEDPHTFTKT